MPMELNTYTRIAPTNVAVLDLRGVVVDRSPGEITAILGKPESDGAYWLQSNTVPDAVITVTLSRGYATFTAVNDDDATQAAEWFTRLRDRARGGLMLIDVPPRLRETPFEANPRGTTITGPASYAVAYSSRLLRFPSIGDRDGFIQDFKLAVPVGAREARALVMHHTTNADSWAVDVKATQFNAQVFRRLCKIEPLTALSVKHPSIQLL